MADTKISDLSINTTPAATDVFPIVNNNITKKISLIDAFSSGSLSSSSNYIVVQVSDDATINGTNLLAAYELAKTLTPNSLPLSSSNRTVIILPPATYDLGYAQLFLNAEFVDLIGLTRDSNHVIITSHSMTVTHRANDIRCVGLSIKNTDGGFSFSPGSNYSLSYWENCVFDSTYAYLVSLAGTFINCKSSCLSTTYGSGAFGGYAAPGTFIDCTAINTGDYLGGFTGYGGNCSGVFTNCTGINHGPGGGGFTGYKGVASGTFINCIGNNDADLGGGFCGAEQIDPLSYARCSCNGIFINCTGINSGHGGAGFSGNASITSGIFINCRGINNGGTGGGYSTGQTYFVKSECSGTFINCFGTNTDIDSASFGGFGCDITGDFINCFANGNGFIYSGGFLKGRLLNCQSDTPLPNLTNSGNSNKPACYVNCLDTSGSFINGSA